LDWGGARPLSRPPRASPPPPPPLFPFPLSPPLTPPPLPFFAGWGAGKKGQRQRSTTVHSGRGAGIPPQSAGRRNCWGTGRGGAGGPMALGISGIAGGPVFAQPPDVTGTRGGAGGATARGLVRGFPAAGSIEGGRGSSSMWRRGGGPSNPSAFTFRDFLVDSVRRLPPAFFPGGTLWAPNPVLCGAKQLQLGFFLGAGVRPKASWEKFSGPRGLGNPPFIGIRAGMGREERTSKGPTGQFVSRFWTRTGHFGPCPPPRRRKKRGAGGPWSAPQPWGLESPYRGWVERKKKKKNGGACPHPFRESTHNGAGGNFWDRRLNSGPRVFIVKPGGSWGGPGRGGAGLACIKRIGGRKGRTKAGDVFFHSGGLVRELAGGALHLAPFESPSSAGRAEGEFETTFGRDQGGRGKKKRAHVFVSGPPTPGGFFLAGRRGTQGVGPVVP